MTRFLLLTLTLVVCLSPSAQAASNPASATLEREFTFEASRFHLVPSGQATEIRVDGAAPSADAGKPELPWLSETFDVPAGMRAASVEVLELATEPFAKDIRLPSGWTVADDGQGAKLPTRSVPDPASFMRAGFQPARIVDLGPQGSQRGRTIASMKVCPVRWDAVTGRLERVTRLRVRVALEPATVAPVPRLRVVPEWEDESPSGSLRSRTQSLSMVGGRRALGTLSATQVPSLLGSPVEYVIITNDDMAAEFQRLADWKTQSGVPAVVRTVSFIRSEYPRGADDAEKVREFLKDAYSRWGTKWVMLGGDTEVIPVRFAYNKYFLGGQAIASDLYYSCLDGNWDGDGDNLYSEGTAPGVLGDQADLLPEVYVGRAPVTSVAGAKAFIDRTLAYAKTPVGDYERGVLMFAEVLFPEDWHSGQQVQLDGASLAEELLPTIAKNPSMRTTRLYQNYTAAWAPGALPETKATVLDSLKKGYGFTIHVGHGYRTVMSVGDANLTLPDIASLSNGARLTNLYAINCTSNAIEFPCIGESFLTAANGGAVTSVGSTQLDFPYAGRLFEREFFKVVFDDSITAAGEAQARQKLPQIAISGDDNAYRWMQQSLLLLGDPELRMWTGTPRTLTVTAPPSFALDDTVMTVTVLVGGLPLAGAKVTAYKVNDALKVGTTNVAGVVVLPFRVDSLGTITLTVTGYDCKPDQKTLNVTTSTLSLLADMGPTVDDDGVGGTSGDADTKPDAGEVVDLRVPVKNAGGTAANTVNGILTSSDPNVTITTPSVSYGTINAGATVTPAGAFRVTISAATPDQREVSFSLRLVDGGGRSRVKVFPVTVRAPDLRHFGHTIAEPVGNGNGIPDANETLTYTLKFKNLGTAEARSVTAIVRSLDNNSAATDSTVSFGDIGPLVEKTALDGVTFMIGPTTAKLQLRVSDNHGLRAVLPLDVTVPTAPVDVAGIGRATTIQLSWTPAPESDLLGYNIYRSTSAGGPFTKSNSVPTDRIAYYDDTPLLPLTRYYYQVTAIDSSGNESPKSPVSNTSTSPPNHAGWPIPMNSASFAPVAVDHLFPFYSLDIASGGDVMYCWHADGTAPLDADGAGATNGDVTERGTSYEGGVSIGDINNDNQAEMIGVASDSEQVVVVGQNGQTMTGWPQPIQDRAWSSVALGDLDNDGKRELVFAAFLQSGDVAVSAGRALYVFRSTGAQWTDGDANPATNGVFKLMAGQYNIGTPAIADLDGNGTRDIIYGGFDGKLYAWRPDGTNLPGFPVTLPTAITGSVAIGYLDGPSDTQLDILVVTGSYGTPANADSLYAFRATGARRPGFPVYVHASESIKSPSPALADMNNDGFLDVVQAGTDGKVYVYDRNGAQLAPWTNGITYSTFTVAATEGSPVVADINGDNMNDVIVGDENATLTAISGMTGAILPGFPIHLPSPVKSAAAVCDCDADGKTEIVLSGADQTVTVWDYDFPFSPNGQPPWPQFHHDAQRTGLYSTKAFTGVEPEETAAITSLDLSAAFPNPARGAAARMWYAIPSGRSGQLDLAIFDIAGRQIRSIASGAVKAGRYSASWDLGDGAGHRVGPGLYFAKLTIGAETRSQKIIVVQ